MISFTAACLIQVLSLSVNPVAARSDTTRNVSYMDAIRFEEMSVEKAGGTVSLKLDIVLDSTKIRPQHTVSLTPVLVSADGKTEFPFETVIVDGKTRHNIFLRRDALGEDMAGRDSALAIVKRKNRTAQEYAYLSVIDYDRRMLDGRVEMRENVSGCADCGEGKSAGTIAESVLPRFIPEWKTSRIEPAPEPVKHREESRIARLQFRWDKSDILRWWKDNAAVLDTVTNSIALVKDKDYISITGIYVAGYASPEGTWEYNMRLSQRRAKSFAKYIAEHNDVDTSLVNVEWSGEDWIGFRAELEKSGFAKKEGIIEVIDSFTEDRNECERQMMRIIDRSEYVWLLRNIYPYLRHCTYRVEYEVKGFDLEEARRVILENPKDLSLNEMYMVAGSYEPESEEYARAMATAAEYYPDEPAVLGDRAMAALQTDAPDEAVRILETAMPADGTDALKIPAELWNILGVAYSRNEEFEKAEKAFRIAADAGSANAEYNMRQLASLTDQL